MCGQNLMLMPEMKSDSEELDSEEVLEINIFCYLFFYICARGIHDKNLSKSFFNKCKSSQY